MAILDEKNSSSAEVKSAEDLMISEVPSKPRVDLPASPKVEVDDIINSENDKAMDALKHAKLAIINTFIKNENERGKLQIPLIKTIVNFLGTQLFFSNIIVILVIILSFIGTSSDLSQVFDLLKLYISGTAIELIGMLWFVTRYTFSGDHSKLMQYLLNTETKSTPDNNKNVENNEKSEE